MQWEAGSHRRVLNRGVTWSELRDFINLVSRYSCIWKAHCGCWWGIDTVCVWWGGRGLGRQRNRRLLRGLLWPPGGQPANLLKRPWPLGLKWSEPSHGFSRAYFLVLPPSPAPVPACWRANWLTMRGLTPRPSAPGPPSVSWHSPSFSALGNRQIRLMQSDFILFSCSLGTGSVHARRESILPSVNLLRLLSKQM